MTLAQSSDTICTLRMPTVLALAPSFPCNHDLHIQSLTSVLFCVERTPIPQTELLRLRPRHPHGPPPAPKHSSSVHCREGQGHTLGCSSRNPTAILNQPPTMGPSTSASTQPKLECVMTALSMPSLRAPTPPHRTTGWPCLPVNMTLLLLKRTAKSGQD